MNRLKLSPEEAFKAIKGTEFPAKKKYILITASGETVPDNADAIIPPIRYSRKQILQDCTSNQYTFEILVIYQAKYFLLMRL